MDKGNESDGSNDSHADMHSLVCHSDSGISYSSADSDYQTESDEDDSDDNESVFSSSNSQDTYGYDKDEYESEDRCADRPDFISPNQQVINTMKKLDTSYNPIARNIVAESRKPVRPVVNENMEGIATGTIDTEESVIPDVSDYLIVWHRLQQTLIWFILNHSMGSLINFQRHGIIQTQFKGRNGKKLV